jgi:hypothetical protein
VDEKEYEVSDVTNGVSPINTKSSLFDAKKVAERYVVKVLSREEELVEA